MFQSCLDDSHKHLIPKAEHLILIFCQFSGVLMIAWNIAVNKLDKDGYAFTVKDGFKIQMLAMVEKGWFVHLKHIIEKI